MSLRLATIMHVFVSSLSALFDKMALNLALQYLSTVPVALVQSAASAASLERNLEAVLKAAASAASGNTEIWGNQAATLCPCRAVVRGLACILVFLEPAQAAGLITTSKFYVIQAGCASRRLDDGLKSAEKHLKQYQNTSSSHPDLTGQCKWRVPLASSC